MTKCHGRVRRRRGQEAEEERRGTIRTTGREEAFLEPLARGPVNESIGTAPQRRRRRRCRVAASSTGAEASVTI